MTLFCTSLSFSLYSALPENELWAKKGCRKNEEHFMTFSLKFFVDVFVDFCACGQNPLTDVLCLAGTLKTRAI
jgi:hypothetical protein